MGHIYALKTTFRNHYYDCEFYKRVCIESDCTGSVYIESVCKESDCTGSC